MNSALRLVVVFEFVAERDYIVNELCEQRNAAVNTCNGSCHMKKQMEAIDITENQDEPKNAVLRVAPELPFLLPFDDTARNQPIFGTSPSACGFFEHRSTRLLETGVFQPPQRF